MFSTMIRKHCLCIGIVVSFVCIANGEIFNDNKPSLDIPADMLSYFDERFASLTLDLTSRLEELESRHADDTRRIDVLEHLHIRDAHQMTKMERDIDGLKTKSDDLQKRVSTLQNHLHTQTSTTKSMASTTALTNDTSEVATHPPKGILENTSSGLAEASNNATLSNSKSGFRRHLYEDEKWGNNLNRSTRAGLTSTGYAFHAVLGHDLLDPGTEQAIAFENLITLVGGHYSRNTGAFSCRQAGVYAFHWTVRVKSASHYMYTELVLNGDTIGTANSYHASTGSGSAVVQLSVGDEVWVRVASHTTGADVELYTSMFSGFLIN